MAAESAVRWLVVSVRSPSVEQRSLLAEGLLASGGSAVVEEGDTLTTWIPAPAAAAPLAARIRQRLEDAGGSEVRFRYEEDRDWLAEWRRGLAPRRIGDHIVVTPTWLVPDADAADIVITIDPQMAFGTGEHASTRLMLRALEKVLRPGDAVLDMGTGSAILAMAAARLGAERIDAAESDADALPNAVENIARNGVADRVRLMHAQVDGRWLRAHGPWDLIVANVLSSVLAPLLTDFRAALWPGGRLLLGGILVGEADGMRAAAQDAGFAVLAESIEEEWWCGAFMPATTA